MKMLIIDEFEKTEKNCKNLILLNEAIEFINVIIKNNTKVCKECHAKTYRRTGRRSVVKGDAHCIGRLYKTSKQRKRGGTHMKKKFSKRIMSSILAFGLAVTMLPISAFAAQTVTTTPGNEELEVEYFTSTLYNWDEDAANAAAAQADYTAETIYVETSVSYSTVAPDNQWYRTPTDYWYRADDGNYYQVYYTRDSSWWQTTYNLYYRKDNEYIPFVEDVTSDDTIMLYIQSNYEGKGFYFTSADNKQNVPSFSEWTGGEDEKDVAKQNYYIYSGLAEKYLSDSENAPFSNENVNAPQLFSTEGNSYTTVYNNVKVPFVYDVETGYYELNSDKWAVYFDGGNASSNGTLTIADKPVSFTTNSGRDPKCGFQPFEDVSSSTQKAYYGTSANIEDQTGNEGSYTLADGNAGATYGFGMVTSVNFQMTDDGLDANGQPIEFSFSGDDDVWVYVDGVLALDIGGTHDAITGTINFQTGEVTLQAQKYGRIGDKATDPDMSEYSSLGATLSQTNLYDALGTTRTGFASQGSHTLTIYYMDRGRGATNCLIRFNLPQRDTVSVTKKIDSAKDNEGETSPLTEAEQASIDNVDFGFTIYEDTTPLANKTYYIYNADNVLIRTASTNSDGHFTLRNGQTARFNVDISEEGKEYYVVEDDLEEAGYTEPEYTWSSSVSGATVINGAAGYTGMTVEAKGSSTAADSISFTCENFLDQNLPNPGVRLMDDTYVIDYGLPVNIANVMSNDVWRGESARVIAVKEIGDYIAADGDEYGETEFTADGSITYTLTKPLDRVVTLEYTVEVTGSGNTGTDLTKETISESAYVYIIPATSMYYEENFSDMITYSEGSIEWTEAKDDNTYGSYQEEGEVGNPLDSTYGTDTVYLNNLGDSYGTSRYAIVDGYAAQFEYDFTGTGTAIYSRISTDSAYIRVEVEKDGANVDRQYIDTRIIGDVATNETLYNVPVYNNTGLEYGTYHVTVTVYKAGTPVNGIQNEDGELVENSDKSGSEFYLDGIKVYQPLISDVRAESAYASDGESNIALINIRSKIVADQEIGLSGDSFVTLTDEEDNIQDPDTYTSIGPNEELYLNKGNYTVSFFLLNWDSQLYDLYLGMKAPSTAATVQVGDRKINLNNSVDCYYDVSDYVTVEQVDVDEDGITDFALGTLTISNASGLVSLTNIKVTGVDEFDIGYSKDLDGGDSEAINSQTLYLLPTTYSFTDNAEDGAEEAVFVPERFDVHVNYARLTKKATVNVATSTDVAYITINGTRVDPGRAGSTYSFAPSFKKITKGTAFEVIAYNSDGVASEIYTAIAE